MSPSGLAEERKRPGLSLLSWKSGRKAGDLRSGGSHADSTPFGRDHLSLQPHPRSCPPGSRCFSGALSSRGRTRRGQGPRTTTPRRLCGQVSPGPLEIRRGWASRRTACQSSSGRGVWRCRKFREVGPRSGSNFRVGRAPSCG